MWVGSTPTRTWPAFEPAQAHGDTGYGSTQPVPVWDMGRSRWRWKRVYATAQAGPNNHPVTDLQNARTRPPNWPVPSRRTRQPVNIKFVQTNIGVSPKACMSLCFPSLLFAEAFQWQLMYLPRVNTNTQIKSESLKPREHTINEKPKESGM